MDSLIPTGQTTPAFKLPDLDGQQHRLAETRGSILVLNFWSAECPWVERADRKILELLKDWSQAVLYWAVASNRNEPVDLLRSVARQRNLPLVLHDAGNVVADLYRVQITPHFFILDTHGFLRYQGALDDVTFRKRVPEQFFIRQAVEALLSGKLPDPAATPAVGCSMVRFL